MAQRFKSKVALITGGNAGIGLATALAFAREGATLAIAARRQEEGQHVIDQLKEIGGDAIFIQTDISNAAEVKQMVDTTVENFGRLDIAFNNAGYGGMMVPCAEFEEQIWDRTMEVNLKGVWLCMKYQIQAMLTTGGGAIINNASAAGLNGGPFTGVAYCASKHGVVGLSKAAAAEYASQGIRINCVCPGVIGTEMADESFDGQADNAGIIAKHPIGRIGLPVEVANTVMFLASDEAPFLLGAAIPVDGGLTLDN